MPTLTAIPQEATRAAYGRALERLGHARPDLVVLDADLSGSTKTAEANMIGHAAGLALSGKMVFVSSFAMFAAGKAWEQIRQCVCVPRLNVKIAASHAGITVGEDGMSHQMLEDIALMRVLPHMRIAVPSCGNQTENAVEAVADWDGPAYLRLSRAATPLREGAEFAWGKAQELRQGSDLALLACGVVVHQTMLAAEMLAAEGVDCTVLDCASIKPLDEATVCEVARRCGAVLTIEEHQIIGGLGEAVCSTLARHRVPVPVHLHGMQGEFGQTGTAEDLLAHYHLDGEGIAEIVRQFLQETQA